MSDADQGGSRSPETPGGDDRRLDFRPGMGMWWEITRSTEDTSGALFEATNWIEPRMPGPPVHVHPTAEESYEVIEGRLEVFMNGEWSPVRAGEKATVPAGVPHSVRNASDGRARIVNIHQPAQRFESFFRDMHRLIHEGKIKRLPPKDPVPPSTQPCCSAGTRTRSARSNRPTRSSSFWRWSGEHSASRSSERLAALG